MNACVAECVRDVSQTLTFQYTEDVEGDHNRGWKVDKIVAVKRNENVGYLKLEYIPSERFKRYYPGILNYLTVLRGQNILPYRYRSTPWQSIPIEAMRGSIYQLAQATGLSCNESNALQHEAKLAEEEQVRQIIVSLEKSIKREQRECFRRFKAYFVDKPMVGFVEVRKSMRRQGIGTALYRTGYEWMKSRGLPFYASTCQTQEAKAIWSAMEKWYKTERVREGNPHHPQEMMLRTRFA